MLELYPRTQIDIHLHVMEADGGVLCACINAACLALVDAGVAMKDLVVACSAGFIMDEPVAVRGRTFVQVVCSLTPVRSRI
jgi:exosome complex component RRP41